MVAEKVSVASALKVSVWYGELKEQTMKRFHVRVRSTADLLMHKFSTEASAALSGTVKKLKSGPPDPAEEAEQSAYRLEPDDGEERGQLCLPSEHFFQSMVLAASSFQVKGQGKKTYKDPVKGNVILEPEYVGLTDASDARLYDYKLDIRPARIRTARINRCRPLLKVWVAEFDIVVTDDTAVPSEVINAILVSAGQTKGVGDYRPRFGRFMVERFEEVTA